MDDAPFPHPSITGQPPKACDSEPCIFFPFTPFSRHPWLLLSLEFAVLDGFKPQDEHIQRPFPSHRLSQVWGSEFKPRFSNPACILKSPSSSSPLISLHPYVDGYKSKRPLFFNSLQNRRKRCRALGLTLLRGDAESAEGGKGKRSEFEEIARC